MMSEAQRTTDHIPDWKREEVAALVDLIDRYESIGVVDVEGIPSRQLQEMRADLHGSAELRMGRNSLIKRALEDVDDGVETLIDVVSGQVGLIGTDDNPFSLYQRLEGSKTAAPINAGEVAPNDITIEAGDTGIDPGPFVGDLQQVGADARIQEGSIRVLSDSTVLEAGEEVSPQLANVLAELGIEPKEVGLDLRAVYADGVRFGPEELAIDLDAYERDVATAATRGRNLAVETSYPTDATIATLLATARGDAIAVGLEAGVEDPAIMDELVARADAQVRALAGLIRDPDALPEELRGADTASPDDEPPATEDETDNDNADAAPDAASEDDTDEDDEDDDAGADALGDMFG
ncbi:MAG: 50S ribosomal protein L10 [Halobacteriaceae archaeon]